MSMLQPQSLLKVGNLFQRSCSRTVWNRPKKIASGVGFKKANKLANEGKTPKWPEDYRMHDPDFLGKVTTIEEQLKSLQLRGFQRSLRPYDPPANLDDIFVSVCQQVLGDDLKEDFSKITIEGRQKADLLSKLADNFGNHRVPNSLVHTMDTLDKVLSFYSTKVDMLSPYDRIAIGVEQGYMPQNLHVQLEPKVFDPENSTSDIGRISAFPGQSKIFVTPEERKKWKSYVPQRSPWKNSRNDD